MEDKEKKLLCDLLDFVMSCKRDNIEYSEIKNVINKSVEKISKTIDKALETTCCLCGCELEGYGNNPYPVSKEGRCCDVCNDIVVIPARIGALSEEK